MLPNVDHPEAFGQHPNADIASQIIETKSVYTLTCYSSLFVSSPPLLGRTRQLLQWLTSKVKHRLQNMRYFLAFFRRARSGRGERDTPATAGKARLTRARLKNAKNNACSTGY